MSVAAACCWHAASCGFKDAVDMIKICKLTPQATVEDQSVYLHGRHHVLQHTRKVPMPVEKLVGVELRVAVVLVRCHDMRRSCQGLLGHIEDRACAPAITASACPPPATPRKVPVHREAAKDLEVTDGEIPGGQREEAIFLNSHFIFRTPWALGPKAVAQFTSVKASRALEVKLAPTALDEPGHDDIAMALDIASAVGRLIMQHGSKRQILIA